MLRLAILLALIAPVLALYESGSPVKVVKANEVETLIRSQPEKLTFLEFFAPWCGYCQRLVPTYEEFARRYSGPVQILAINCDDDGNKQFCAERHVQKYPTIKVFRTLEGGSVDDEEFPYQHKLSAFAKYADENMPNRMRFSAKKDISRLMTKANRVKAVLFSQKMSTMPALKYLSMKHRKAIDFVQVYDTDEEIQERFDLPKVPALVIFDRFGTKVATFKGKNSFTEIEKFIKRGIVSAEKSAKANAPKVDIKSLAPGVLSRSMINVVLIGSEEQIEQSRPVLFCVNKFTKHMFFRSNRDSDMLKRLNVVEGTKAVIINSKKNWMKTFDAEFEKLEDWIEDVQLGQGGRRIRLDEGALNDFVVPAKKSHDSKTEKRTGKDDGNTKQDTEKVEKSEQNTKKDDQGSEEADNADDDSKKNGVEFEKPEPNESFERQPEASNEDTGSKQESSSETGTEKEHSNGHIEGDENVQPDDFSKDAKDAEHDEL